MDEVEFLKFGATQIRHQIREIITSYSHGWDLLAETVQNAVDAIKSESPTKGHIKIRVNQSARKIVVEDNGCGIDPEALPQLLSPFSSSKTEDPNTVGEKGVGVTFVLFSSVDFEIQTRSNKGACGFKVVGANGWLASTSQELPKLARQEATREAKGTTVSIRLPVDHPLFHLGFDELNYVLRTKTAIGDTAHVFNLDPFNCDYELTLIDQEGKSHQVENECRYLLPTEYLQPSNYADIDDFEQWRIEADRSDAQKRNYWRDKAVIGSGSRVREGRQLRFWYFYVPRRNWWNELNTQAGLSVVENDEDELPQLGFSGGMEISTKFTPSGVSEELKPRGSAGYIPNFFFLLDDPGLKLDIGRKSVARPPVSQLTAIAYEGFRRIINDVQKYTSGAPEIQTDFDKDEAFAEIESSVDVGSEKTHFLKRPSGQEAMVAAMFFEAVGNGSLSGYKLYSSGYKGKYDLFARKGARRAVIEFKYSLLGLLRDFRDETKLFAEVDVVVVWRVDEQDRREALRRGLDLVENKSAPGKVNPFPEATKKLSFSVGIVRDIYVIEMANLLGVD